MTHPPEAAAVLDSMRRTTPNGNIKWDCPTDGCYRDHLPDWSSLNDCFPRAGIRVSDIDGMVEVGGHFLFFEWKQPRATVPDGQMKALTRLTTLPRITVIILWGHTTSTPDSWQIISGGEAHHPQPITFDNWHAFTSDWATTADAEQAPRPASSRLVPALRDDLRRTSSPHLVPVPLGTRGTRDEAHPQTTPEPTPPGRD